MEVLTKKHKKFRRKKPQNQLNSYAKYTGIAFEMIAFLLIGYFLGQWADNSWDTHPWMKVTGAFVGIIGAMVAIFKSIPKD